MIRYLLLSFFLAFSAACSGSGAAGDSDLDYIFKDPDPPAPPEPPAAPVLNAVTGGDGFITIEFSQPSGSRGYELIVSGDATVDPDTDLLLRYPRSPAYYTGLGASEGPFYFAVQAFNNAGSSPLSNVLSGSAGTSSGDPDPLYSDQWHLKNTGQEGGTSGEDIDVEPVWTGGNRGEGALIAVVDDGLEIGHEDLRANVLPGQSFNYLDDSNNPSPPDSGSGHGTCVGGVSAARDLNGTGVRGVASRANLVGYNLLQDSTAANEADAMARNAADVWVSNNSWGPSDDTGWLDPSPALWKAAIDLGLSTGRGGLGTVYTWAAGNGGSLVSGVPTDNSNYDGYANYRGVMAICAVGDDGVRAYYSELGANLWVCTPSEGRGGHAITTADLSGSWGYNDGGTGSDYSDGSYTNTFNGTSSATPVATGAAALVLAERPELTWRDLRVLLAETARKNDPSDGDWDTNGAGFNINHQYGFGIIDADAAVTLAGTWTLLDPEETPYQTGLINVGTSIPDDNTAGVSDTETVTGSGIGYIEWVEIEFSADNHTYSGDLKIELTNETTGTVSILAERHRCLNSSCTPYDGWTFGSARHLGETADGDWTLKVSDRFAADTGTFQSWRLKFYGH